MSGTSDATKQGPTLAEKIILASLKKQNRRGNSNTKTTESLQIFKCLELPAQSFTFYIFEHFVQSFSTDIGWSKNKLTDNSLWDHEVGTARVLFSCNRGQIKIHKQEISDATTSNIQYNWTEDDLLHDHLVWH